MISIEAVNFEHEVYKPLEARMVNANTIPVGEWQAQQGTPHDFTLELQDVSLSYRIRESVGILQKEIKPNLPWAEDHFQERISGHPHNPPPSHEWWPFAQKSNEEHTDGQKFSHTYPERFWPKFANIGELTAEGRQVFVPQVGLRFEYGDLADLVELLIKRPNTRQAYLPVWFPEDLNAANRHQERVPCTLGYHFMARHGHLSCRYYIRSCDFHRHFRDDVYMAARLTQYIVGEINQARAEKATAFQNLPSLIPGDLIMHISSLHVFADEREMLRQKVEDERGKSLREKVWW